MRRLLLGICLTAVAGPALAAVNVVRAGFDFKFGGF
jgi:hypothetical protein